MAQSGLCREPLTKSRHQKAGAEPHSTLHGVVFEIFETEPQRPSQNGAGGTGSGLREIQFHTDAIGIIEEELRISGARNDALAEFDVPRLQALAHALDVAGGKGNVIEPSGVLIFLF